jgi:hypothetical protein
MIKEFHCYISEIETLSKFKKIIKHFGYEVPLIIHENIEEIPLEITSSVFFIDDNPDFFLNRYSSQEKRNVMIMLNDTIDDTEDFPVEAYISKKK